MAYPKHRNILPTIYFLFLKNGKGQEEKKRPNEALGLSFDQLNSATMAFDLFCSVILSNLFHHLKRLLKRRVGIGMIPKARAVFGFSSTSI